MTDFRAVADKIREASRTSRNEAELRIAVEGILGGVLADLGIKTHRAQEMTVFRGRVDALYGDVIVEYKAPGSFRSMDLVKEAIYGRKDSRGGLHNYMLDLAKAETFKGIDLEEALARKLGVGLDGERIFFYRYRPGVRAIPLPPGQTTLVVAEEKDLKGSFERVDVTDIERGINRFILSLRTLARFPLTAAVLAEQFGISSKLGSETVQLLYNCLSDSLKRKNPHVETLFHEWQRIFGIVYDTNAGGQRFTHEEVPELANKKVDVETFLFSAHTYLNLVLEFVILDLLSSFSDPFVIREDFLALGKKQLRESLERLEEGELFRLRGLERFYEGGYFGWYLDEWSDTLATSVQGLLEHLERFDPATTVLQPEAARDILKELYQSIVPDRFRHNLGEYFTPDWLAQRALDVADYSGDPDVRLLDPACGSGTFLVEAIKRFRSSLESKGGMTAAEELSAVVNHIVGYDINPVSVLVAKANYLMALGELVLSADQTVIPVFQCDSILAPRRVVTAGGERYFTIHASQTFKLPTLGSQSELQLAMELMSRGVKSKDDTSTYLAGLHAANITLDESGSALLSELYEQVQTLDKKRQDGIWPRILSSAFAPVFAERFDLVIGNPPWVNWDSLSPAYKRDTAELWIDLGLFGTYQGGKDDLCLLMTYLALKRYVRENGKLCFLLPQSIWQSKEGGERFRRFRIPSRANGDVELEVERVEDFSEFQPFEATNRTSLALIRRDHTTTYPLPYHIWKRVGEGRPARTNTWTEVASLMTDLEWAAKPVDKKDSGSPWLVLPPDLVDSLDMVIGKSAYQAREGVNTRGRNGVYYVDIEASETPGLVTVRNDVGSGRKELAGVTRSIEAERVFPLLRGGDVDGLEWKVEKFIVMPHSKETGMKPIPATTLASNYRRTHDYLKEFRSTLESRSKFRHAQPGTDPFYQLYEIGPYTFDDYKVVWPYVRADFAAAVISPVKDRRLGSRPKTVIPDTKLMIVSCKDEREASFVGGILNSIVTRTLVNRLMVNTQLSTYLMDYLAIPKFSPKDPSHTAVERAFAKLRINAAVGRSDKIQRELDSAVAKVFGLSEAKLATLRRILRTGS